MSKYRKHRLEALEGWTWDPLTYRWEIAFKYLEQYVLETGDAHILQQYRTADGFNLGTWVSTQRQNKEDLSKDRKKRLEAFEGWVWDPIDHRWEVAFKYLEQYVLETGDAHISQQYRTSDGFNLGAWVTNQRANIDNLAKDRRARIEALDGWVWNTLTFQWEEGFQHLEQYLAESGDTVVKWDYKSPDGYNLGSWVGRQRTNNNLTDSQRARLDGLKGWVWKAQE